MFDKLIPLGIIGGSIYLINELDENDSSSNKKIVSTEFCDRDVCKNTCNKINATKAKPGGEMEGRQEAIQESPDNKFKSEDCNIGTKLLTYTSTKCGGDGESECNASDCCTEKTCGSDLFYTDDDIKQYLLDRDIITEIDIDNTLDDIYNKYENSRHQISLKKMIDRNCPYQQTIINDNLKCNGSQPGIGGDCTMEECCKPKTCSNNWINNDNTTWINTSREPTYCPSQPDKTNIFLKKPDETPCDICNIDECCFEQINYCMVPNSISIETTNIKQVSLNDKFISKPNTDKTYDLTQNDLIKKNDIINNKDDIQSELINNIECISGYKYGMCNSNDINSDNDDNCKEYDNNRRECENNNCSFNLSDKPRVEFYNCNNDTGNEIIVGNCTNICTADNNLKDNGNFFFNQINNNNNNASLDIDEIYKQGFQNNENSISFFDYGSDLSYQCSTTDSNNENLNFNYNCEGGGDYFNVSNLDNCFSTCDSLYNNGNGLNCGRDKIYKGESVNDMEATSDNFKEICCDIKNCQNLSNGNSVVCNNNQKLKQDSSINGNINEDNCCEKKTCSDYLDDFEALRSKSYSQEISNSLNENNICNENFFFQPDKELGINYLDGTNLNEEDIFNNYKSYRGGDNNIGCCVELNCSDALYQGKTNDNCDSNEIFSYTGIYTGGDSCCENEYNTLDCYPSNELSIMPDNIDGYNIINGDFNISEPLEFQLNSSGNYIKELPENIEINCINNQDKPKLQCFHNDNGSSYYSLIGCEEPPSPDTNNSCSDGNELDEPKMCGIPSNFNSNNFKLDVISGVTDNKAVFMEHFSHQLNKVSCIDSTQKPCINICEKTYDPFYIDGCDYKNNFKIPYFSDQFKDDGIFKECSYETINHDIPQEYIDNTNVRYFKCPCNTEDYLNNPENTQSDKVCERNLRFKYVFSNDKNSLDRNNTLITNQERMKDQPFSNDIVKGEDSICSEGYFPFRGQKYDYCKPCSNSTSDKHPINNILTSFCNNGKSEYMNPFNLIPAPNQESNQYDNVYKYPNDIPIGTNIKLDDGSNSNEKYSPYAELINSGSEYPDFKSDNNFTFGTRVCKPSGENDCADIEFKLFDYSKLNQIKESEEENNYFNMAKKWWNDYFDKNFENEGFENLKLQSKINKNDFTEDKLIKNKKSREILKNRIINYPDPATAELSDLTELKNDQTNIDLFISDNKSKYGALNLNEDENSTLTLLTNYDAYDKNNNIIKDKQTDNLLNLNQNFSNILDYNDINNLQEFNASHYLYRDILQIKDENGKINNLPTVCNNNLNHKDFIPSGFVNEDITGSCKECVNKMPSGDDINHIITDKTPKNSPNKKIVRNIRDEIAAPICSLEAGMYKSGYNQGNLIGFKNKNDGIIYSDGKQGPCEDGFVYYMDGVKINEDNETKYIKCLPEKPKLVNFCGVQKNASDCNLSYTFNYQKDIQNENNLSSIDNNYNIQEGSVLYNLLDEDYKNSEKEIGVFCGWNNDNNKCEPIYKLDDNSYLLNNYDSLYDGNNKSIINSSIDLSDFNYSHPNQSIFENLDKHITTYSNDINYTDLINNKSPLSLNPYGNQPNNYNISSYIPDSNLNNINLRNLSAADQIQKGKKIYDPQLDYKAGIFNNNEVSKYEKEFKSSTLGFPQRINPMYTILNPDQRNNCHRLSHEGPLDFFYDPKGDSNYTISNSCYLRSNASRNGADNEIITEDNKNYGIKSTPLYYGKSRDHLGGTLTSKSDIQKLNNTIDNNFNILNPIMTKNGPDGLKYSKRHTSDLDLHDTGYSDAARFPIMQRVHGCHNTSLVYSEEDNNSNLSPLGISSSNLIDNQREQCIFSFKDDNDQGINNCINACLNHNDCDLVKMTKDQPIDNNLRCEFFEWVRLPSEGQIKVQETILLPNGENNINTLEGKEAIDALKNINLGGHLINADPKYDETTAEGVDNWYRKMTGQDNENIEDNINYCSPDPELTDGTSAWEDYSKWNGNIGPDGCLCNRGFKIGDNYIRKFKRCEQIANKRPNYIQPVNKLNAIEINKEIDINSAYRSDFNTEATKDPPHTIYNQKQISEWRENIFNDYLSDEGNSYIYKGRPLWISNSDKTPDDSDFYSPLPDKEIWYSMNKIKKQNNNDSNITNIFKSINTTTLTEKIGNFTKMINDTWFPKKYNNTNLSNINEDDSYISNDSILSSSTTEKNKKIINMIPDLDAPYFEKNIVNTDTTCSNEAKQLEEVNSVCPPRREDTKYTAQCNSECAFVFPRYLENCTNFSDVRVGRRGATIPEIQLQYKCSNTLDSLLQQDNFKECPEGTYVNTGNNGQKYCSQVLNECASCSDINTYLENKGEFDNLSSTEKKSILLSYGCPSAAQSFPNVYASNDNYNIPELITYSRNRPPPDCKLKSNSDTTFGLCSSPGNGCSSGGVDYCCHHQNSCKVTNNLSQIDTFRNPITGQTQILDAINSPYKFDNQTLYTHQHNLVSKTPDGTIIDAEKCICPGNKLAKGRRTTSAPHHVIAQCQ